MPTTATKERPILFSGPMVRAILDGSKTQTRRIVKPQPETFQGEKGIEFSLTSNHRPVFADTFSRHYCPMGAVSDRLWVRENFSVSTDTIGLGGSIAGFDPEKYPDIRVWYQSDNTRPTWAECRWRPSIHMPRWASRITLEVIGVRVERLRDISEQDAIAEGFQKAHLHGELWATARSEFWDCWESIYGQGQRAENPWVWVVEFKRLEAE